MVDASPMQTSDGPTQTCFTNNQEAVPPPLSVSASSAMGRELTAELDAFEINFTSAGNMRVDVRSKDHHGDLVIATALALWSAVGRLSGRTEVGRFEGWY
jgi:hypothetical protein